MWGNFEVLPEIIGCDFCLGDLLRGGVEATIDDAAVFESLRFFGVDDILVISSYLVQRF